MSWFTVTIKEVHDQDVAIEADSTEEATRKVEEGEGEQGPTAYNYTLGSDTWDVTKH